MNDDEALGDEGRAALARAQDLVRADLPALEAFGREHADVFGETWFDGPRLQVGLTRLAPYEELLRGRLRRPELVDVVLAKRTTAELARVRANVQARVRAAGRSHLGLSSRRGQVQLSLTADGEQLAARLRSEFGDVLTIRVGGRPYPPRDGVSDEPGPVSTLVDGGLRLTAERPTGKVTSGADFSGFAEVRNTRASARELLTGGGLTAFVLADDGTVVGGLGERAFTLALHSHLVAPGGRVRLPYVGGTAGGPRYATPPGDYRLVVSLHLDDVDQPGVLVSPPVPVRVLPPRRR